MKSAILVLATCLSVTSLAAVTGSTDGDNEALPPDSQQRPPPSPSPPPQQISEGTPFACLPRETLAIIFPRASLPTLWSVCQGLRAMIQKHFMSDLKASFEDPWLEMYFESEQERDHLLSILIAWDYAEMVKKHEPQQNCTEPVSSDLFDSISGELENNRLMQMLPTLPSSNPRKRLRAILSGAGYFSDLPLAVRQVIAAKIVWKDAVFHTRKLCSLSSFLSSFHNDLGSFKESLLKVNEQSVLDACAEILLRIDCERLSVEEQGQLLVEMQSLFPENEYLGIIVSAHQALSPDPSISQLLEAVKSSNGVLDAVMANVLPQFPGQMAANWCMKELERPAILTHRLCDNNIHLYLLFSKAFRTKHGISDTDQTAILKSCTAGELLKSVSRADLTDSEVRDLVKWIKDTFYLPTLSFDDAITLYSLDDDLEALEGYSPWPHATRFEFISIILGRKCGWHLTDDKRNALLKRFYSQALSDHGVDLDSDRATLLAKVAPLFDDCGQTIAKVISDQDLSLLMETWLDNPEAGKVFDWLDERQQLLATRVLIECIHRDPTKQAKLPKLPDYAQAAVCLLTKDDAISNSLSAAFKDKDLLLCLQHCSRMNLSREEAARVARRLHALYQLRSTSPETE